MPRSLKHWLNLTITVSLLTGFAGCGRLEQPTQTASPSANPYAGIVPTLPAPEPLDLVPDPQLIPPTFRNPTATNPQLTLNEAEMFIDGEAIYPMVFETVDSARVRIQLDLFVFGGEIGMKLAQKLVERKKMGVQIMVMMDPNLGFAGPTKKQVMQVVEYLKSEGVAFKTYPLHHIPSPHGLLAGKFQIDHNKLIVVDNKYLIMGGMNFFDMAVPNRDVMFRIQGPLVQETTEMMLLDWSLPQKNGYEAYVAPHFTVPAAAREKAAMRLIKTDAFERSTKQRVLDNIRNAKRKIYIAMFEFSDMDIVNALIDAHRRGLDVKIIMDKKNGNDKYSGGIPIPSFMPNILPAREFINNNMQARWFKPFKEHQELHKKVLMFDDDVVMTGSTNLTYQALNSFRETSFELRGTVIPKRMHELFQEDWNLYSEKIEKLTTKQKILAEAVEYMDKRFLGWW